MRRFEVDRTDPSQGGVNLLFRNNKADRQGEVGQYR